MDFDQLHTFLEIVRLKSFSKAAQTCYRTQPAISAQIRQLEQDLKTELFERFGSRISLTTAGKIFAGYAEQILDLRRRAQDALNELEITPRGELVIAANEATCIYMLPGVFAEYRAQFPAVQLQVNRSFGSRVVEAVMENVADFGMTQLPVAEKRAQVVDIYKDEVRLIVPPSHPLANRPRVACEDLVGISLLLPKSGTTRSRLDIWLEPVEGRNMVADQRQSFARIAGVDVHLSAARLRQRHLHRHAQAPQQRDGGLAHLRHEPVHEAGDEQRHPHERAPRESGTACWLATAMPSRMHRVLDRVRLEA